MVDSSDEEITRLRERVYYERTLWGVMDVALAQIGSGEIDFRQPMARPIM